MRKEILKRRKNHEFAYLAILVVLLVALAFLLIAVEYKRVYIMSENTTVVISAEVADSNEEWAKGLSFRKRLDADKGMLFVLPDSVPTFWMKNMQFPLDIIIVSPRMRVIDIKENFQPCVQDPCERYKPPEPVRYAVEVNAGFVQNNGIKTGDTIRIEG